jgi:hypothetical protein
MMTDWYYVERSAATGPVSLPQIRHLVVEGVLTPETLLWNEFLIGWVPAAELISFTGPSAQTLSAEPVAPCPSRGRPRTGWRWPIASLGGIGVLVSLAVGSLLQLLAAGQQDPEVGEDVASLLTGLGCLAGTLTILAGGLDRAFLRPWHRTVSIPQLRRIGWISVACFVLFSTLSAVQNDARERRALQVRPSAPPHAAQPGPHASDRPSPFSTRIVQESQTLPDSTAPLSISTRSRSDCASSVV